MPDAKGWTKSSNQLYLEELKQKRAGKRDKNSGRRCDYCILGNHDRCYRVGCYCPCVHDKEWYKGWPNGKTVI